MKDKVGIYKGILRISYCHSILKGTNLDLAGVLFDERVTLRHLTRKFAGFHSELQGKSGLTQNQDLHKGLCPAPRLSAFLAAALGVIQVQAVTKLKKRKSEPIYCWTEVKHPHTLPSPDYPDHRTMRLVKQ